MLEKLTSSRRNLYIIVIALSIVTLAGKFFFNGLIYGLDFSLFHPDGTLYTFRSLSWLGNSQMESGRVVSDWYSQHAGKMTNIIPASLYFDSNPNWPLYKFRILYSFLSVPFVYVFGIYGMLVIPALSYIGLLIVLLEIGRAQNRVNLALIVIFLISTSLTITRWMFINTTDSLFTFLAALSTYLLMKWNPSKGVFVLQFSILALMIATRVSLFYAIPLIVILYFKSRKQALILSILAIGSFIPLLLTNIQGSIAVTSTKGGLVDKILSFISNSMKLLTVEMGQLVVFDKVLLALLVLGIVFSIRNLQNVSSKFFLLSTSSSYLMSLLNGTLGVNFRFQLPIIAALVWVLLENSPRYRKM
jgi:hypothetical protein